MPGQKILITYASNMGATAEVALAVCRTLGQAGAAVDFEAVEKVRDLRPYRAVVLGTAIRQEQPLPEAVAFVQTHRAALARLPVAVFALGITVREDTPENRAKMRAFLAPLLAELPEPVSLGLFAGRVDYARLSPVWRWMVKNDQSGQMREGDWRDWEAINSWAADLARLLGEPVALPQAA
jgi:menaquinone-dependent protoporphyrinogen oxidase